MNIKKFIPIIAVLFLFGCNNNTPNDINNENSETSNEENGSSESELTYKAELINNWNFKGGTEFASEINHNKALEFFNASQEGLVTSFESENMFSGPNDADGSLEKPCRLSLGSSKASGILIFNFSKSIKKITTIATGYKKYEYASSETTNLSVKLGDNSKSEITYANVDSTFSVNFDSGATSATLSTFIDDSVNGYRVFIKSIVVEW